MKRLIFLLVLLTPCLATSTAPLNPPLQAQLDSLPLQAVVEAFLVVKRNVPIGLLKASLTGATRQRLHGEVVTALREQAVSTQADLLSHLSAEKTYGRVLDYKSYWIDNYVFVRATKEKLLQLAERSDVTEVYENPRLELVAPMEEIIAPAPSPASLRDTGRAQPNLIGIGSRQLWKRGLTGKGRLVCNLDTGIDGNHRAFKSRWRGRQPGVSASAAWFDPVQNLPFPHTYATNPSHGTHVLGIMCGLDTLRFITNFGMDTTLFMDTIGVAPDAEWISAAVIDNGANGSGILDALEWAADPDGNPNTIEDVPDAVNNSWAYPTVGGNNNLSCNSFFWQAIDNVEAAGTVAFFAAGNSGPTFRSIGNPADRGTTPFSSFAVGNFDLDSVRLDPSNPDSVVAFFGQMASSSSRGPTECGPDSLKPEVVAPGTFIYSSTAGGQFGFLTGTSMAAPHVAGAVALLRQYNPNATVDTIKWALALSASDVALPGPDTLSGFGLINLPRALELMPPNDGIHVYVKRDRVADANGQFPYAGGTFDVLLTLANNGTDSAFSLYGKLAPADSKSEVLDDSASFGDLPPGDSISNGQAFKIRLASVLVSGERFRMTLTLFGAAGFSQTLNLTFTVGEKLSKTIYNHSNGNVEFTVSNFGQFGFEPGSLEARSLPGFQEGLGFERKTEPKVSRIFEGSFMVGINDSMVSNTASNEFCCFPQVLQSPDADFAVHPGGNLKSLEPGLSGGVEASSIFDDRLAKHPIGLVVAQRSCTFDSLGQDNFALLEYRLYNRSGSSLANLWAGLFFDFNFHALIGGGFLGDKAGFDRALDLGYEFNETAPAFRGVTSVDTGKLSTFKAVRIFPGVSDGFTLAEKWAYLTSSFADTLITSLTDGAILAAKGPFSLAPDDSVTIAFALVAAKSLDSLKTYAETARRIYRRINSPKGDFNGDRLFTAADVVLALSCVFLTPGTCPLGQADMNCDGLTTMTDVVILINRVFLGLPPPCA